LRQPVTGGSLHRAFRADNLWGLSAALLIGSGLWRYLGSIEKNTGYYNHDVFFLSKMALLGVILALEVWPAITLMRWRLALKRGDTPKKIANQPTAGRISAISFVQASLIAAMVVAATAMARGYGA
jgi:putative membrane protein